MAASEKSSPKVPSPPARNTTNGERLLRVGEAIAPASSAERVTKLTFVKTSTGAIQINPKTPPALPSPGSGTVKQTD